jgi:hypothetical protein
MLVLAMEFSRINSESCRRRDRSLPQNGIEEKSGSTVEAETYDTHLTE